MPVYDRLARYYDLLYDRTEDIPFVTELARRYPGPVLDAACGTGRISLHLARAGYEVVAYDVSPDMLRRFQEKLEHENDDVRRRVTLVHGDVRNLDLPGRQFALVISLWSVFFELPTREDRIRVLRRITAHLQPGGAFAMDNFFQRDADHSDWGSAVRDGAFHLRKVYDNPWVPGWKIRCYEAARFDPATGIAVKDIQLDHLDPNGDQHDSETITAQLHYARPEEVEVEVREVGFREVAHYGWFDFTALYDPQVATIGRQILVAIW